VKNPAIPPKVAARLEKLAAISQQAIERGVEKAHGLDFDQIERRLRSLGATLVHLGPVQKGAQVLTVKATGMKTVQELRKQMLAWMPNVLHQVEELGGRRSADSFSPAGSAGPMKLAPYSGDDALEASKRFAGPMMALGADEVSVVPAWADEVVTVVPAGGTTPSSGGISHSLRNIADYCAASGILVKFVPSK
jgi:hypothetical protein